MNDFASYSLTLFHTSYKLRLSTLGALLRGKKTATVMTFAYFYQLETFYGTLPLLQQADFETQIDELVSAGLLNRADNEAWLTKAGQAVVAEGKKRWLPFLPNGILRIAQEKNYWQLFFLAMQVLSNYSYQETDFLPIVQQEFLQMRFKAWFRKAKQHPQLMVQWKKECDQLLHALPQHLQPYLVERLTGYQLAGKTTAQLAGEWQQDKATIALYEACTMRICLTQVQNNLEFPLLSSLLTSPKDAAQRKRQRTITLYQQSGATIPELARRQQLKEGTVFDHLLEAFFTETIDLRPLLTKEAWAYLTDYQRNVEPDVRRWQYAELKKQWALLTFIDFRCYQVVAIQKEGKADGADYA